MTVAFPVMLLLLGATSPEAEALDHQPLSRMTAATADPVREELDAMTLRPTDGRTPAEQLAITTSCCDVCVGASCVGCNLLDHRFTRGACGQAGAAWWATVTGGAGLGLLVGAFLGFFPAVAWLVYGATDDNLRGSDLVYGAMGIIGCGAIVGGGAGACGGAVLGTLAALVTFGETLFVRPGPRPRRRGPRRRGRRYQVQTAPAVQHGEVPAPTALASAALRY